jgi:hypothetical protein
LIGIAVTTIIAATAPASAATVQPLVRLAAAADIGIRLIDAPNSERHDPRATIYIVDHLAPGTVIHRRIEVSTTATSSVPVALYAAGATIAHGAFLGSAGHTRDDVSAWTSVYPSQLHIPAHGSVIATITVAVPRDAAPGEHYGVVWAEARSTPGRTDITEVNRVGIRLYLSVGFGGAPVYDFAIATLRAERARDGRPSVVATVRNTGGRALDMTGSLQLSHGPGGLRAGPFPVTLGVTLAIGTTEPITIVLDSRIPNGPWEAEVTLASGSLARTVRAVITFPNFGASTPVNTTTNRRGWPLPATAAFGLVFLVLAGRLVMLQPALTRRVSRRG